MSTSKIISYILGIIIVFLFSTTLVDRGYACGGGTGCDAGFFCNTSVMPNSCEAICGINAIGRTGSSSSITMTTGGFITGFIGTGGTGFIGTGATGMTFVGLSTTDPSYGYPYWLQDWLTGSSVPTFSPMTGFCNTGEAKRYTGGLTYFPDGPQRRNQEIPLRRYCEIPGTGALPQLCEVLLEPTYDGKCGVNATRFTMEDTAWIDEDITGLCELGIFSGNNTFTNWGLVHYGFPTNEQRTGTITLDWQCASNDGGLPVSCRSIIDQVPQCGVNAIGYNGQTTARQDPSSLGFCGAGTLVGGTNPSFPNPTDRFETQSISRGCANAINEVVTCNADIEVFDPCGSNARTHFARENNRYAGASFPTNTASGFCAVGTPGRSSAIGFPSITDRLQLPLQRTRYCNVGGDISHTCKADFDPIFVGECGPNARSFLAAEENRDTDGSLGFCKAGSSIANRIATPATQVPYIFPNDRTIPHTYTWQCNSPDVGPSSTCAATVHTRPTCGSNTTFSYSSLSTGWNTTASTGFCLGGNLVGYPSGQSPRFPTSQERVGGGDMTWICENSIGETAACEVTIPEFDPCGFNTDIHEYRQKDRHGGLSFPNNTNRGFCEIGTPGRYKGGRTPWISSWYTALPSQILPFPNDTQRTNLEHTFNRFCAIPGPNGSTDTNHLCSTTIAPILHGVCGTNATGYNANNKDWMNDSYEGFCAFGTYSGLTQQNLPQRFRRDSERLTSINYAWSCVSQQGGGDVNCSADISTVPTCGINQRDYSGIQTDWMGAGSASFCTPTTEAGFPGFNPLIGVTPVFPRSGERIDTINRTRECQNSIGDSTTCSANIAPYSPCGSNAVVFDASRTTRNDSGAQGFCQEGRFVGPSTVYDFPRSRSADIVKNRTCVDDDLTIASCEATIEANEVFCGDMSNRSIMDITIAGPAKRFCTGASGVVLTGVTTIGTDMGTGYRGRQNEFNLGTGRRGRQCELYSSDDDQIIQQTMCNAHRSCQRKGFEHPHGSVLTSYYSTDKPPIGMSCEDVRIASELTCYDGFWTVGSGTSLLTGDVLAQNFVDRCDDSANRTCIMNGENIAHGERVTAFKKDAMERGQSCSAVGIVGNAEVFECRRGELVGLHQQGYAGDYPYLTCNQDQANGCTFRTPLGQEINVMHGEVFPVYNKELVNRDQTCTQAQASLQCINGNISMYSTGVVGTIDSYPYIACMAQEGRACFFNGETIVHGESVTGRNYDLPTVGHTCQSQQRTCIDGVLSGTFEFNSCDAVDGVCGIAINDTYEKPPSRNLCAQGNLQRLGANRIRYGKIALATGFVNQIQTNNKRATAQTGVSTVGQRNVDPLQYCKVHFPNTTVVQVVTNENINGRCQLGNVNCVTNTIVDDTFVRTYECMEEQAGGHGTGDRRSWQCMGYGGDTATCAAPRTYPKKEVMTGSCAPFPEPVQHINEFTPNICQGGRVDSFSQSETGRTWNCIGDTNDLGCFAINTIKPSAEISYSPSCPTDTNVVATLNNFNVPGTRIINNNGKSTFMFTSNGEFVFHLEANGKVNYLTASVDCIDNRNNILQDMIKTYHSNMCSNYQHISFEDMHDNPYTLDIQTMLNTCVMHGYHYPGRHVFLPNKNINRCETVIAFARLGSAITDYTTTTFADDWQNQYKGIDDSREFAAQLVRAEKVGILSHLNLGTNTTKKLAQANVATTYDIVISQATRLAKGSQIKSGTTLTAGTTFITSTSVVGREMEIGGIVVKGDIMDANTRTLLKSYTYTEDYVLESDIEVRPGSVIKVGSILTSELNVSQAIDMKCDTSVTRTEFTNMLQHFLDIHRLDNTLANRITSDMQYTSQNYLTRGETAYIFRRLMEPYAGIPIGQDYKLLNAIFTYTKDLPIQNKLSTLDTISTALKRMPIDTLGKYGLTKFRLLEDLDTLRTNSMPERKPKQQLNLDTIFRTRENRRQAESIISPLKLEHFTRDRYDELEF